MRRIVARALLLGAVLALVAGGASRAEIYRCQGADGKTLFSSDRSRCPGAERHEPSARIERVPASSGASVRRSPTPLREPGPEAPAASEALWREKKLRAEAELQALEARLEHLRQAAGWCNRGHSLFVEDETGIRRSYDCRDVHDEYEQLKARVARVRLYLDEGLGEECRRAGCLPGWIR